MKKWFEILQPGTLRLTDENGCDVVVRFRRRDVLNASRVGNAKLSAGWQIPVCWDHQDVGPVRLSHADRSASLVKNTIGYVDRFDVKNGVLCALADIPDPADAKVADKVKYTSPCMDRNWRDSDGRVWVGYTVQHVAITNRPVQRRLNTTVKLSISHPSRVCLSWGEFTPMADETKDDKSTESNENKSTETGSGGDGSPNHFSDAINMLAERGIILPEDTTAENAWERLTIALTALNGADEVTDTEEEIGTVTTNNDSPLMLSLQKQRQQLEKFTRADLANRINTCVSSGRITPQVGRKLSEQLTKVKLSFNKDAELQPNDLITRIEAYEDLPKGAGWTPTGKRVKLSNTAAREVNMPKQLESDEPDDSPEARKKRLDDFEATKRRS